MVGDSWARWAHSIGCFDGPSRSVPFGPTRRPALWIRSLGSGCRAMGATSGLAGRRCAMATAARHTAIEQGGAHQRNWWPRRRRRGERGSFPDQRADLAGAGQGFVRCARLRHPEGGAPVEWRRVQGGGEAALHRGRTRQLEGPAHRSEPKGLGHGPETPGRRIVARCANPAGDGQLARHDRASRRFAGDPLSTPGTWRLGTARAADIRQRPRSHSRGHLSDVRRGRIAEEDVGADRRSRTRRGRVIAGGRK
jgi:hypothetical protein